MFSCKTQNKREIPRTHKLVYKFHTPHPHFFYSVNILFVQNDQSHTKCPRILFPWRESVTEKIEKHRKRNMGQIVSLL